ncbi:MAG: TSUP family transporter [Thiotrichaceae bacterium]
MPFSHFEWTLIALIFIWTGFVRTGLGFGGAALGLPLMLLVGATPLYWLPIIGIHLLFFSSLTLFKSLKTVDWLYLKSALIWILPASLIGVAGLISLPDRVMIIFIYSVTLFYAFTWLFDKTISSHKPWVDRLLLFVGGYVAGTSLTGAPLIVAVFMRHVDKAYLRNTLFVLWFTLVTIKLTTFVIFEVKFDVVTALWLIPIAAIGHVIGLKAHAKIIENDRVFKQWVGGALLLISAFGLAKMLGS